MERTRRTASKTNRSRKVLPETLSLIAATVTEVMGAKVRIRSAKTLPDSQAVGSWARQGRVAAQTSHDGGQERTPARSRSSEAQNTGSSPELGPITLQITIDDRLYEVELEVADEGSSPQAPEAVTAAIQSTVLENPPEPGSSLEVDPKEAKLCRSPLVGIVVRVPVVPGQQLQSNHVLVVLEAMKMETSVMATIAGTLKFVNVVPGDSVKMNQILVEFD
jgi:methylmalonyl-CoA carboxyltransferase small subunit